jgi:polysaccharide pyruvyl transferase WcaK-like protein
MTRTLKENEAQKRSGSESPILLGHFVNARSANVGNGALTDGAEYLLREDLRRAVEFRREAWDDYSFGIKPFDRRLVEMINSRDAMIVGGAVAMNARPHYSNAGMRFDMPPELWSEIRKPIVFYGLSYRHWRGQTYHHADKLAWTLKYILDRDDMLLGLRNDGTREWLTETIGVEDERLRIVPDPGVFAIADTAHPYHEFDPDRRLNILLAFNDEDWEGRYSVADRRTSFIRGLVRPIERMIEKWDANLIIVPHYFDDYRMAIDFVESCRPQVAHQRMIASGLAGLRGGREFFGRYVKADMVISMRVHSMSPAIGLGTPMIPLVTQDRMTKFLDDIGLRDLAVDAFDADMPDRLEAAIDRTLSDPNAVRLRFATARASMRDRARAFNAEVGKLLGVG